MNVGMEALQISMCSTSTRVSWSNGVDLVSKKKLLVKFKNLLLKKKTDIRENRLPMAAFDHYYSQAWCLTEYIKRTSSLRQPLCNAITPGIPDST